MNPITRLNNVILKSGSFTALNAISGFILNLLYVRYVGLSLYGQMSLILSVSALFFSLTSLGVSSSITRILTEYLSESKQIFFFIICIFLSIVIVIAIVSYPSLKVIDYFFDLTKEDLYYVKIYILINIFIFFPYTIGICIYESSQELSNVLNVNILINIVKYISFIVLMNFEINLKNTLLAFFLIPNLVGLLYIYFKLYSEKYFNLNLKKSKYDIYMLKKLFIYSFKFFPLAFSEILLSNVTFIYLNNRFSYSEIGLFRILNTIVRIGLMLPHFASKVLLPFFTKMFLRNHLNIIEKYFLMFVNIFFSILFIIIIPLILFKNEWFSIINSDIDLSNHSLVLLAMILYVLSANFIGSVYSAINKPQIISFSSIFSSVAATLALFYLNFFEGGVESCLFFLFIAYFLNQFILFFIIKLKNGLSLNYFKFLIELILIFGTFYSYVLIENLFLSFFISLLLKLIILTVVLFLYVNISIRLNFFDFFVKKQINLFLRSFKIR